MTTQFINKLRKYLETYTVLTNYDVKLIAEGKGQLTLGNGTIITFNDTSEPNVKLDESLLTRIMSETRFGRLSSYFSTLEASFQEVGEVVEAIETVKLDIEFEEE